MALLNITWYIFPFKNQKSLTFCELLEVAISYFWGMGKFRDLPSHIRRPDFTNFFSSFFPSTSAAIGSRFLCGHNLTMKFPPDFHNYAELNKLVNFFS